MADQENFEGWAILELMGHLRTAGYVTEEEHFGCKLGRIDIPNGEGSVTQYFGGSSIYRLTPTTEEIARAVALRNQPAPVQRWELPAPKEERAVRVCIACQRAFRPAHDGQLRCGDCEAEMEDIDGGSDDPSDELSRFEDE